MSLRSSIARLLATGSLVVLAACGSGGDGTEPSRSPEASEPMPVRTVKPGQHGPIAEGEYTFDGAVKLSGEYSVLYEFGNARTDTCEKLAAAAAGSYVVPLPTFNKDMRFVWQAGLRDYGGPGTYGLDDLEVVRLDVREDAEADPVIYTSREGATVELIVKKDNSGSMVFEKLSTEEGDEVSGRATWKCSAASD